MCASEPRADVHLIALNTAAVLLADELLQLPAPAAAATAVDLLWGPAAELPDAFVHRVGSRLLLPLSDLMIAPMALVVIAPERVRALATPGDPLDGLRQVRALAHERYGLLQTALARACGDRAIEPKASLVRYTIGLEGRHWLWSEAARRLIDRAAALNRAVLRGLVAASRGETDLGGLARGLGSTALPASGPLLDGLASALLPVAAPDFAALASALAGGETSADPAVVRYQALFAELLGRTGVEAAVVGV